MEEEKSNMSEFLTGSTGEESLTLTRSKKLIRLGVDSKLATGEKYIYKLAGDSFIESKVPVFRTEDILIILPKEIEKDGVKYKLHIYIEDGLCEASYDSETHSLASIRQYEPLEALYQLLLWCLKRGYYNPKNERE